MATDKTPPHKRIARAEKAREEWKMKAVERREEAEKWKTEAKRKDKALEELNRLNSQMENQLNQKKKENSAQKLEIENLKKKSPLNDSQKPFRHRFLTSIIHIATDLYALATIGCRKIARVLEVILPRLGLDAPHHTTVRQWVIRNGHHQLHAPLEKADDWILLGDVTVDVGTIKCLAIVGIRMAKLQEQEDMILSHKDVEVLGLYPTESSTGEHVLGALRDVGNRVGNILEVVIDQGSDVTKGVKLYQDEHPEMKIIHDIKHKLSLVLKRSLEKDCEWEKYTAQLAKTRQLVQQTEFAALMPATQRSKARFMDIGPLIDWPARILECRDNGGFDDTPDERCEKYLVWIGEFINPLQKWKFMVQTLDLINHELRTYGLSQAVYENLMTFFLGASLEDECLNAFIGEALEAVGEEVAKLDDGQTLLCSTEVLESIFGKYKAINQRRQGITGNVLGIPLFVGPASTADGVQAAMEGCSVKKAITWIKERVGDTVTSVRRRFFSKKKGTKLAKTNQEAAAA